jgi:hypothetical protein
MEANLLLGTWRELLLSSASPLSTRVPSSAGAEKETSEEKSQGKKEIGVLPARGASTGGTPKILSARGGRSITSASTSASSEGSFPFDRAAALLFGMSGLQSVGCGGMFRRPLHSLGQIMRKDKFA